MLYGNPLIYPGFIYINVYLNISRLAVLPHLVAQFAHRNL